MPTNSHPTTATAAYGESWYWDKRYASSSSGSGSGSGSESEASFDWYQKYPSLAPLLHLYIPRHHRVLVVGCGNSAFSEGMVNDGYAQVFNIDISSVVIAAMQRKYSSCSQLKYMKMDVRDMNAFEAGSFDAVVDKGTLDSILCGNNSQENAAKMLQEVGRVLEDRGIYLLITYGAPNYRLHLLRNSCSWTIKLHVIGKLLSEETSQCREWDLTFPVPLDDDGISTEAVLGKNPDVHYIYVCIKDKKHESTI
ncbi:unnamed protein product [Coffea canephora]|uniref:Methyltransferase type 11 domain-containing protein n=1 Tax=Coffea canephora TaxID=49390 RepID=A0A068TTR6_COFCA|nr:unnamed protein product [Coffea canephora]